MSDIVMRGCCEDAIVASPYRHEPGFRATCPTCGNVLQRTVVGNGFEVVRALHEQGDQQ